MSRSTWAFLLWNLRADCREWQPHALRLVFAVGLLAAIDIGRQQSGWLGAPGFAAFGVANSGKTLTFSAPPVLWMSLSPQHVS